MTHSKQFNIMLIDRFKRAMKVLRYLSFIFLASISTHKTPVFAQDSIQEACSNTKVSLPIFIPLEGILAAMEKAVPHREAGRKNQSYPIIADGWFSWDIKRSNIQLSGGNGQLLAATKLSGVLRAFSDGIINISAHANVRAEAKLRVNPEFQDNWSINPDISGNVTVLEAEIPIGPIKISAKSKLQPEVNRLLNKQKVRLDKYVEEASREHAKEIWSALNIVEKLSQEPPVWLVVTPRAFATTQPRITSTGVYLHFVAEAETDLKIGTPPKKSTYSVQLPSKLRILDTSENGSLDVAMPIIINFRTFNSLIEDHLKNEPVTKEEAFGTIKLNEVVLASPGRDSFTMNSVVSLESLGWLERLWNWITGKEVGTQRIVLTGKPTLSPDGKQIIFRNVNLSEKSSNLILKLKETYEGLTGELVESLIQDNANINLDSFIAKSEKDMQAAIDRYAKKLQEEKNINVTAKILPKTRLASIDADRHSFLIKACASATLAIDSISFNF